MIRHLSLEELLELHRLVLQQTGGLEGVRDLAGLESAVAQPQMMLGGKTYIHACRQRPQLWGSRWYATIRSSMATNELGTWRWKCSWSSTGKNSLPEWMNKSASLFDLPLAS
jgi:hypothetical protein